VYWAAHAEQWHSHPIYGSIIRARVSDDFRLDREVGIKAHNDLVALQGLLTNQTAETIDAFIAENPGVSSMTKLAIASVILKGLYGVQSNKHELALRPLVARELAAPHPRPPERNWIHLLINIVRHGIDSGSVSTSDKIKIVTFNYDTVLEHVLEEQFSNREVPLGHYKDFFEIVHVHGQFPPLARTCSDPGKLAIECAAGINVVNEKTTCHAVEAARARAKSLVWEANKIYAIGFSFAGPNCRLLGLDKMFSDRARQLIYCNYDGNRGIAESAKRYVQAHSITERPGDFARPLSATDFIKAGFLGEPPG